MNGTERSTKEWSTVKASSSSLRVTNPIRDVVDQLKIPANPPKPLISLSIGDPTVFGNLDNPDSMNDVLIENIKSRKYNGYTHSTGYPDARAAIAKKYSVAGFPLTLNDVIITSGCSGALELAIGAMCDAGQNLLLPAPGFSIYETICQQKGIEARYYRLLSSKDWEIDLDHLESLIDDKTAAMIVNNPSNPCGSVYSKSHLEAIIKIADKNKLPIIADEIYDSMVFSEEPFVSLASVSTSVPILSVGGLAKMYVVPGWRIGWILIHDRNQLFQEVRVGLLKLSQIILGGNTLVQSIIPKTLHETSSAYYRKFIGILAGNAEYLSSRLSKISGLTVIRPGGAMYMMIGIDTSTFSDIKDDIEFAKMLLFEEMVFTLPGTIFKSPNFLRLVICPPMNKLEEACDRIQQFCDNHRKK